MNAMDEARFRQKIAAFVEMTVVEQVCALKRSRSTGLRSLELAPAHLVQQWAVRCWPPSQSHLRVGTLGASSAR